MYYKSFQTKLPSNIDAWSLPHDGKPGEWMLKKTEEASDSNGYSGATIDQLVTRLGSEIYEIEYAGHVHHKKNEVIGTQARLLRKIESWNECTARLFACDCAEHVLNILERYHPDDTGPRTAIEVARRYAMGEISLKKTNKAFHDAWDSVRWEERSAAYAAEAAAETLGGFAANLSSSKAREAAGASDDPSETRKSEREWQSARLSLYINGPPDAEQVSRKEMEKVEYCILNVMAREFFDEKYRTLRKESLSGIAHDSWGYRVKDRALSWFYRACDDAEEQSYDNTQDTGLKDHDWIAHGPSRMSLKYCVFAKVLHYCVKPTDMVMEEEEMCKECKRRHGEEKIRHEERRKIKKEKGCRDHG